MGKNLLTEETFKTAKILLSKGMTGTDCAKYLELSSATISRINTAKDWNGYLEILRHIRENQKQLYIAKKAKVQIPVKEPEPVAKIAETTATEVRYKPDALASNYQINRMIEEMKQTNEYLKLISKKLAFLVEALA